MRLSVFVLFLSVPAALLRTFPTVGDCGEQGTECVFSHECPPNFRSQTDLINCQKDKICCWKNAAESVRPLSPPTFVEEKSRSHDVANQSNIKTNHVPKALYLTPEKIILPFYGISPKTEYTTDKKEALVEERIVNFEPLNNNTLNKLIIPNTKTTTVSNRYEDGIIVFPNESEEEVDEHIKNIKRLYLKYTLDFNRYNSKMNNVEELLPKRKQKYAVGYRSLKHCKMYERYITDDTLLAMPLLPSLYPIMMQNNHCSKPLPLIVGGTNASKGEFPHMSALGYDRGEWIDFLCGASLISERYVLTAAHCGLTKWGPPIIVRLGTRNLITDDGKNMDVEDVIMHPDYEEPSCYNDIALVKMAPGLQLESTLRPACLPPPTTLAGSPGSYLVATGWGRIGYGLFTSPNLQKVSLQVMENNTCEKMFLGGRKTDRLPNGIQQNSMLCAAGYLDSTHDTCQGDSGGPLQATTRHSKCMFEIIGITSFGKLCGSGLPAIYTRVSSYVSWIEDIVWPS